MCRHVLFDLPLNVPEGSRQETIDRLDDLRHRVESCTRCPLYKTRTRAVFGEGDPFTRLMFVGEAPGYHEDQQGRPFVGAAGKLLDELLASIELSRDEVYIANVLKSRPPGNRDPRPEEIEACRPYLEEQVRLIRPVVICSLGNFATKLLSGSQTGITKVHGVPQTRESGGHRYHLYPIYHPAAALRTPSLHDALQTDFYRLPQLMSSPPEEGRVDDSSTSPPSRDTDPGQRGTTTSVRTEMRAVGPLAVGDPDSQLGLF